MSEVMVELNPLSTSSMLSASESTPIPRGYQCIIGFDHAVSGRDESVAFIGYMKDDGALVEHEIRAWLNTLIHEQVDELARRYPTAYYCIDATAEGGKECLGYFERASLDVIGVDFGKSKQTLMITLKNAMQQGLFKFSDDKLRVQLSNYKFKESDSVKGRYKFGEPGTPDDRVDAAALANYRAFLMRGYGNGENSVIFQGDRQRVNDASGIMTM